MTRNIRILFVHPKNRFMTIEESYTDILGVKHTEKKTLFLNSKVDSTELREKVPLEAYIEFLCFCGLSRKEIAKRTGLPYKKVWSIIKFAGIACKDGRNPIGDEAKQMIANLYAAGIPVTEIAEKVGCSKSCVKKYRKGV